MTHCNTTCIILDMLGDQAARQALSYKLIICFRMPHCNTIFTIHVLDSLSDQATVFDLGFKRGMAPPIIRGTL